MRCPLCYFSVLHQTLGPFDREYFLCENCKLIHVPSPFHLSLDDEMARYKKHHNGPDQTGHVRFLSRAIVAVEDQLKKSDHVLDYGCGPVPTLSALLNEKGFACDDYDPIFFPVKLNNRYAVIFSIETFEHFRDPRKEVERLLESLSPCGYVVVMTETYTELSKFQSWYYACDPTHVAFYHEKTFDYIAEEMSLVRLPSNDERVFILKR